MSSHTDAVAQAARNALPKSPAQIRTGTVADLRWIVSSNGNLSLTLFVDFGSGAAQVAATQDVLDQLNAMETASTGTGRRYVAGRTALTVTPSGNGMPIVIGYLGSIFTPAP